MMSGSIALSELATLLLVSQRIRVKTFTKHFSASCVPDCDGNTRKRRGVNRRELPFVSLGHDIEAEFPIQRRNEGGEEIFIIEERNSNSTPLTRKLIQFYRSTHHRGC